MSDRLVKPKTRAGTRAIEKRAPRMVEILKKAMLLFGGKTSQVVKVQAPPARTRVACL